MANRKRPRVFITRKLPDPVETRMRELFDATLNIDDAPLTQPQLIAAMADCDVLVPTVTDRIDAAVIEQAGERLKLIANFGNGTDNIDVDAAARRGITVTNTPNVLSEDTADMTMALILAVPRRLTEGARLLTEDGGSWQGWSPTWMVGNRIWVAIARAMVLKPRFVMLDEPTSALDMSVQAQVVDLLRDLQREHDLAYLFISHDLKVVRALANDVIVMRNGKVVEQGTADRIFDHPETDYTKALMAAAFELETVSKNAVSQ